MEVVIPKDLQQQLLRWLHEKHLGIVQMKMVARPYVWCINLDKDIEAYSKNFEVWQATQNVKKDVVKSSWKQSVSPIERFHLDFFLS